ncbi:hypothetical protein FCN77_01245 [Arthrobacter sp. 24S4-2]|uniref:hypothetical protein n=1 Tax=Arthrobacter sp. 24S4-2 TaxID=2575374 RepID=UPI0010C79B23|nr:hypothetical protein [Arthrobacter sp. 24S4-2]QCO96592.1 hypothetical protein FCN77_01245 [Arthrobacter sp. 24S4-2]
MLHRRGARAPAWLWSDCGSGPAQGQYILNEAGGSNAVRFVLDLNLTGRIKVLDGLVAKTMPAEVAQLRELKAVVEAR